MGTKIELTMLEEQNYCCKYCGRLMPVYTLVSAYRCGVYENFPGDRPWAGKRLPVLMLGGFPRFCFGYTVDHVIPIARCGTDDDSNLVLACASCNARKSNRSLMEWLAVERSPWRREQLEKQRAYDVEYQARADARASVCDSAAQQDIEALLTRSLEILPRPRFGRTVLPPFVVLR